MKKFLFASLLLTSAQLLAAPFVSSINRQPLTTLAVVGSSTVFRVTFNASVTGVDISDFTLLKIGTVTGTVASVSAVSGSTYDVTVNSISGSGTLRLDLNSSGTGIVDGGSNAITNGWFWGQVARVGNSAPVGWGNNTVGQLGNGTNSSSPLPVATTTTGLLNGKNIVALTSLGATTIALTSDNLLFSWGQGLNGFLGNGTSGSTSAVNLPVAVDMTGVLNGKSIISLGSGASTAYVTDSAGVLYAWGSNSQGQLGDGLGVSGALSAVPVATSTAGVLSGKSIIEAKGGSLFSVVCTADGGVYTWGQNTSGQLGTGDFNPTVLPVAVSTAGVLAGKRVVSLSAGSNFVVALTSDGRVYTWGQNSLGQLGDGLAIPGTNSNVPIAVSGTGLPGGKTITKVACGTNIAFALASDGTLYAWGAGANGGLGNGGIANTSTPTPVTTSTGVLAGKTIVDVVAGNQYAYVLTTEGKAYSWGATGAGQLGDNSGVNQLSPVAVDTGAASALNGKTLSFLTTGSQPAFAMAAMITAVVPVTTAPSVTTDTQSTVTHNSATLGGNVTADGGASVTDRGIVWSTNANPTTADTKVANGSGTGTFSATVTGLPSNTLVHVRAYATNSVNTSYGADISFTTLPAPVAVSSLTRVNATPTNAATVNWTLTFASAVTGVTASNFTLTGPAAAGLTVGTPAIASGGGLTWTIPVNTGATEGLLTLNLANATGLSAPISTSLPYAGESYTIDKTPPTVLSVTRLTPTGQNTNLTTVTFRVTYSEPVTLNAPATNRYQVVPVNGSSIVGTVTGVTGTGNIRDVTVNLTSGVGEFKLRVVD